MKLNADARDHADGLMLDSVEAQALQPFMLVYDGGWGDDGIGGELSEVDIVAAPPRAYLGTNEAGREQRWVEVPVVPDVPGEEIDPIDEPATARVLVVLGFPPENLEPLLAPDLYPSAQAEALARNGMCHERVDEEEDAEEIFCGLPSYPFSFYRLCQNHDEDRQANSEVVAGRGYNPTYGAVAEPA